MQKLVNKDGLIKLILKIRSFKVSNILISLINCTFYNENNVILIVFQYNVNDSLAYKTQFMDYRGEKGRDKSNDMSPKGFMGNRHYQTSKDRCKAIQIANLKSVFTEKFHRKQELMN